MIFENSKCIYCGKPIEIMQVQGRWISLELVHVMIEGDDGLFELVAPWHFPACPGRPLEADYMENQKP